MAELVCSAKSCAYNQGMYCSKGDINVGGEHARGCQDTCCESFRERTGSQATSSMGSPSMRTNVCCSACECRYNENHACHAGKVDIAGAAAHSCCETECTTFEER